VGREGSQGSACEEKGRSQGEGCLGAARGVVSRRRNSLSVGWRPDCSRGAPRSGPREREECLGSSSGGRHKATASSCEHRRRSVGCILGRRSSVASLRRRRVASDDTRGGPPLALRCVVNLLFPSIRPSSGRGSLGLGESPSSSGGVELGGGRVSLARAHLRGCRLPVELCGHVADRLPQHVRVAIDERRCKRSSARVRDKASSSRQRRACLR